MQNILIIFIGGGMGCVMRFLVSVSMNKVLGTTFPWGTATVNILGSLVIGFLLGMFSGKPVFSQAVFLFAVTGFFGGFTTFSAFSWDTFSPFKEHGILPALQNIILNVAGCLLAVGLGAWLGKQLT